MLPELFNGNDWLIIGWWSNDWWVVAWNVSLKKILSLSTWWGLFKSSLGFLRILLHCRSIVANNIVLFSTQFQYQLGFMFLRVYSKRIFIKKRTIWLKGKVCSRKKWMIKKLLGKETIALIYPTKLGRDQYWIVIKFFGGQNGDKNYTKTIIKPNTTQHQITILITKG